MFDPAELLAALDRAGVEHIIIGGLAVAAHGYVRATKDLDIVPSPDAGTPVLVCSREDLIAMKRAAGRPQDLEDLRQLSVGA